MTTDARDAGAPPVERPVVQHDPERFCVGMPGRHQCDTCGGKYRDSLPVPAVVMLHQPWPFEPCPHYVLPIDPAITAALVAAGASAA